MAVQTVTELQVALLAECLRAAREAGEAAGVDTEDGGTCNMDSPAFKIPRMREADVQRAAELADVQVSSFEWFGGRRWYWVLGAFIKGQGNRRARISHAANQSLKAAAAERFSEDKMRVCEYCQMD